MQALGWSTTRISVLASACAGAHFKGSVPGVLVPEHRKLHAPVTGGIIPPSSGCGYRLDAGDGGVFVFGHSRFWGSVPGVLGRKRLNGAVYAGLVPLPSGRGYWLIARDGGVFTFGKARFYGSLAGQSPASRPIGIVSG